MQINIKIGFRDDFYFTSFIRINQTSYGEAKIEPVDIFPESFAIFHTLKNKGHDENHSPEFHFVFSSHFDRHSF